MDTKLVFIMAEFNKKRHPQQHGFSKLWQMIYLISMRLPKYKHLLGGQILIGILISIGVFAILANALFTLILTSYQFISYNKARITARQIAQEKLELIKNLPYNEIGTIGGVPTSTVVAQTEDTIRNGLNFRTKVDIVYIDDSLNGTGPPNDADYKRVRVEVSWGGIAESRYSPIVLITDIAPQKSVPSTGGTLNILVFNANGDPVPGATVDIIAASASPPVSLSQLTDSDGKISLPGTPACNACYKITVTRAGYNSDRTYSTVDVSNPLKPDATVLTAQETQVSFAIDEVGSIDISSVSDKSAGFSPIANVSFELRGSKLIGTDSSGQPVYKYDKVLTTDSGGNLAVINLEWDNYQVQMPASTSYDIGGMAPIPPLNLAPAGDLSFTFVAIPHTDYSLLTIVKNTAQNLLDNAFPTLDDGAGNLQTIQTGDSTDPDFGQAFFSGLNAADYTLTATASGYLNYSNLETITGNNLETIIMGP